MQITMRAVNAVGTTVQNSIFLLREIPASGGFLKVRVFGEIPTNEEVAKIMLKSSLLAFAELVESLMRNPSPQFSELDDSDTLSAHGLARLAIKAYEEFEGRFDDLDRKNWAGWNEMFHRFIGWLPEEYNSLD